MYTITTTDLKRKALWYRLFGTAVLPVKRPYPRERHYFDGKNVWVYDLDTAALTEFDRRSLASYLASRQHGLTFEEALKQVQDGWTISAKDCQLQNGSQKASVFAV